MESGMNEFSQQFHEMVVKSRDWVGLPDKGAVVEDKFALDDDPKRWHRLTVEAGRKIGEYFKKASPGEQSRYLWRTLGTHGGLDDDILTKAGIRRIRFGLSGDNGRAEKSTIVRLALGDASTVHHIWPHIINDHERAEVAGEVSRVAESGRRMLAEDVFPGGILVGDKWNRRVMVPNIANPLVAFVVEREFDRWNPAELPPHTRDNMALMGYLFGFFDPKHPKHDLYRRLVLPTITDDAPEVVKRLKPKDSESLDSKRLQRLKEFWPKTFMAYWSALCRTEGRPPVEVTAKTAMEGKNKLPMDPNLYMPKSEAAALTQAQFYAYRRSLIREIGRLANDYSDRGQSIEPEEIAALFNREACHAVFDQGAVVLKNRKNTRRLDEAAVKLVEIFDKKGQPSRLEKLFGPGFAEISSAEKVALLTYCAFVSNGSLIRSSERAVQIIEREIVPALKGVHDIPDEVLKELQERNLPEEEKYNLGRYMQFAMNAGHRMIDLKPKDGIVSTNDMEVSREIETKLQEMMNALGISAREIETALTNIGSVNFMAKVGFFVINSLAVFTILHRTVDDLQGARLLESATVFSVSAIASAIASMAFNGSEVLEKKTKVLVQQKVMEKVWAEKLAELRTSIDKSVWELVRTGVGIALGLTAAYSLAGQKDLITSELEKFKSTDGASYDIGNKEGENKSTQPRFIVLGENVNPGEEFWVDQLCFTAGTIRMACLDGKKESIFKEGGALASQTELINWSQEQADGGKLVRINLDPSDMSFQTPVGYGVADVAYVGEGGISVDWGPLARGRILPTSGAEQVRFAVAYEPTSEMMQIEDLDSTDLLGGMGELRPGIFDEPGMEKTKAIHDWTKSMYENRLENGMTNRRILTGIQDFLKNSGVSYGFEDFDTTGMSTSDVLREMSRTDKDGNFVHNKWICNQFSYYTYLVARSAGMEVYMPVGYQQDTANPYGGSDASRHQIILFKNEDGLYEIFDATLPSLDYLTEGSQNLGDPLEALVEQERNRNIMIASLAASMTMFAASGGIMVEPSVRSAVKKAREKSERMLRAATRESIYATYHAMMWLKNFDTEETNKLMGSRDAYAAQIAQDVVALAIGERSQSALAFIESINGHAEEEQKNKNLDWVAADSETNTRMKEGGRLVLENLQRYKETHYRNLSRDQRQKIDKAFQFISTWVKARPARQK